MPNKISIITAVLSLFICVLVYPIKATRDAHHTGWFVVLKRTDPMEKSRTSPFTHKAKAWARQMSSKVFPDDMGASKDYARIAENKNIMSSSLKFGLILTKNTLTASRDYRILEFVPDANTKHIEDHGIHTQLEGFVQHLNSYTNISHTLVFKEKNYRLTSHEINKGKYRRQIIKTRPLKTIQYFPTTIGRNNSNRTVIRNLDANIYCRFTVGSGRLGYQPGTFSWGIDVLDQRGGNMDGTYCPYGGIAQGMNSHVYILDSGIGKHNSMDTTKVTRDFDYFYNSVLYGTRPFADDQNGHGSHVAGLVGSSIYGVAPNARIHVYKVLDDQGFGSFASLAAALSEIYSSNVRSGIITMSLGTKDGTSQAIVSLMNGLMNDRDFIIVASAGNDNANACNNFPSNIPGVVSIGATDITNYKAFYSNFGSCLTMYSFGTNIISCGMLPTSSLISSGTSMAAPIVAGTYAVYKQVNPSFTNNQLKSLMLSKSTKGLIKSLDGLSPNVVVHNGLGGTVNTPPSAVPIGNTAPVTSHSILQNIAFILLAYIIL